MRLSLIFAQSENGILGANNTIPWHAREEQLRFKKATWGKILLMGRNTFDSLPTKLQNRHVMVLTSGALEQPDITCVSSVDEAISMAGQRRCDELVVAGGAHLYEEMMPVCDVVYQSIVHVNVEGDVMAPEIPDELFTQVWSRSYADTQPPFTYKTFITNRYRRNTSVLSEDMGIIINP